MFLRPILVHAHGLPFVTITFDLCLDLPRSGEQPPESIILSQLRMDFSDVIDWNSNNFYWKTVQKQHTCISNIEPLNFSNSTNKKVSVLVETCLIWPKIRKLENKACTWCLWLTSFILPGQRAIKSKCVFIDKWGKLEIFKIISGKATLTHSLS